MNRLLKSGVFAACFAALALPVAAEETDVTLQAVAGSIGGVPMMIIEGEGLDEKYGFKGQFEYLSSDGLFQNFLIGNSDVSMDNDMLGVAIARAEGFDVSAVYPVGNLYLGIVVPGSSDAQTPEDLRGMRVGHFGADSGTTSFIRLIVQEMYGFDVLEEYEMSQVGPAALVQLLAQGEVDAIFNFESFVSEAMVATDGRYLLQAYADYSKFTGGYAPWITNIVMHNDWMKENPATAYAVRDAYDEAIAMLQDSKYEILRKPYIVEKLGITSDAVLDQIIENGNTYGYFGNDWSDEKRAAAQAFLETLAENGSVIKSVPEGIMVTLEEAIGPRP
ncbi:ABC transporter substrate-binding protein [Oceaniovalibus sp. ACAM 378]|uniref:ABC transporter substrate-binding protein n=1 Tax=Oceaniovalibus sp. ACAM 378 TaxID=2599923 RepID=UPI0011D3E5FD|nr:ABC transporter substrate-binding protein [Oceaniovalibus sp. ACAM 378]TYB83580.1 ABC transporter substrate-binding protein [Oceaniovalibus sp. ACAM 378]